MINATNPAWSLSMLIDRALVAIPCKLAPGAFSGERVFTVTLANGEPYTSLAPRQFCWNAQGQLVSEGEPSAETDGTIAAKLVAPIDNDQVQVEVPDGEVIAVTKDKLIIRPSRIEQPKVSVPTS